MNRSRVPSIAGASSSDDPAVTSPDDSSIDSQAVKVLREFVADCEAVGVGSLKDDWSDLAVTYGKAKAVLGQKPAHEAGGSDLSWQALSAIQGVAKNTTGIDRDNALSSISRIREHAEEGLAQCLHVQGAGPLRGLYQAIHHEVTTDVDGIDFDEAIGVMGTVDKLIGEYLGGKDIAAAEDDPDVTATQDPDINIPAGLDVAYVKRSSLGGEFWSLPPAAAGWMKDPASRFLVRGRWMSLEDVDKQGLDHILIEAVAGKPANRPESVAGEEKLSELEVRKQAKALIAWAKEHRPFVVNHYEMIASEEGRKASFAAAWETACPGLPVNAAIIEEAHRLSIKAARDSGRYHYPIAHGDQVRVAVDAAYNDEAWEHVGHAFRIDMRQQNGESVVEMVRRSIKHREGLVRAMLTALAAEEGADPGLATEEVLRATYAYLRDDI